jgi:Protein of unknown function (DUF1592)/Protein of unknown function (DUF1588)/Protein of unknown function (DUF1587)/Protein of unknown function (DUF1595)/Protein of unknown function (DUF1585)
MAAPKMAAALCGVLSLGACERPTLSPHVLLGSSDASTDAAGSSGDARAGDAAASSDDGGWSAIDAGALPTPGLDPGRVAIARLNNLEYDNTIRDLLGLEANARATFQPDESGDFDNNAEAFTMNDARYEQYFDSAGELAQQALADPAARARILVCTPAMDPACFVRIVRAFGTRAWRRPLTDDEVTRFSSLAGALTAAGRGPDEVISGVVQAMLSSTTFLYRIEWDPDPTSLMPHAVAPYELASRLSYWLWSSMPDDVLFALAASGELSKPSVLVSQVDRMLSDARSDAFVESFAGQWLGIRDLQSHQVEPTTFPEWDPTLRDAMENEMTLYFASFLHGERPFDQFLDADVNFVNARLATFYGMDATGLGAAAVPVQDTIDARKGYLGLGGFLTLTSFSYRTDPRTRARAIERLLCTTIPVPGSHGLTPFPPAVMNATTAREQIDAIVTSGPSCKACHDGFEPLGLALEEFDGIGRQRTVDEHGAAVASGGMLADGTKVPNEADLADTLALNPSFLDCATNKSLGYALGRTIVESDTPYLERLRTAWGMRGNKLPALLEQIVVSDTFRFRRGENVP